MPCLCYESAIFYLQDNRDPCFDYYEILREVNTDHTKSVANQHNGILYSTSFLYLLLLLTYFRIQITYPFFGGFTIFPLVGAYCNRMNS